MKQVDGRILPLSAEDIAQRQADAAARKAERELVPWHLVIRNVLLAGSAGVDGLAALVKAHPDLLQKIMAAKEGIYRDDQEARAAFAAAGLDPDLILQ